MRGQSYQQIMPADNWSLTITEDLAKEKQENLSSYIKDLIRKPFDLSADYMLRADLVRLDDQEHILVVTMHHMVADGWSKSILVKEVILLYEAYTEGREAQLPKLPVQYADYAIWQRQYMDDEVLEDKLGYWKRKLEGVSLLQLPTDYSRPAIQTAQGATRGFLIDQGLSAKLMALSHQHGATLYMTVLSVFNILLHRYSGQEDICVGTPIAGRNQQELEGMIGFFLNTLALRNRVTGDKSFNALLDEVKVTTMEAYSHQEVPLEKVVEAVVKERDRSRSPLFQVLFSLQNTPDIPELKLGDLQLTTEGRENITSRFDIAFALNETSTGIRGTVEYATDLYNGETIERMITHYINLLESVVAKADALVSTLGMLGIEEEETLLVKFNNTHTAYAKDKSIVTLFEEQAVKTPDLTALICEGTELTYRELNKQSNRLGSYLRRKYNVESDHLIGIKLERNEWLAIAILGVLKSGAGYVPIDPEYPQERIDYIIADSGCKALIDQEELSSFKSIAQGCSDKNPEVINTPSDLAYVIYTSGTTGNPKGVTVEHRNLSHFFGSLLPFHRIDGSALILPFIASHAFDISIFQLFMPLLSGGTSILVTKKALQDMEAFLEILKNATAVDTVPGLYNTIVSYITDHNLSGSFDHIKRLYIGGDAIPDALLVKLSEIFRYATITVMYGPTEGTIFCTRFVYEKGTLNSQSKGSLIGSPIPNAQIYITDAYKNLQPIGVIGELCIGGAGLTRGYLNQAELTANKFIANPFHPAERIYRTGDLARWLPGGTIEFTGRLDDQVKVRGFRIELGEIESVLAENTWVNQAVVLARPGQDGDTTVGSLF